LTSQNLTISLISSSAIQSSWWFWSMGREGIRARGWISWEDQGHWGSQFGWNPDHH
jgi:hypothetical protein